MKTGDIENLRDSDMERVGIRWFGNWRVREMDMVGIRERGNYRR